MEQSPKNNELLLSQYCKPEIVDYGQVEELTAQLQFGAQTDVPIGTPVLGGFILTG